MLEAINSTILTSGYTRIEIAKVAPERSYAVNPEKIQEIGAKFMSPYIVLDSAFSKAIFTIRDSATGDVLRQYPTESQIRAYQRSVITEASAMKMDEPAAAVSAPVSAAAGLDPVVVSAPAAEVSKEVAAVGTQQSVAADIMTQASGGAAQSTFSTDV